MNLIPNSELLNAGYRYAYALTMHRQDAEDLLHDAWIRLITRYGESPEKPMLFRTIRNLFIDGRRHAKVVERYRKQVDVPVSHPDESVTLMDSDLLERHLVCLRPVEREVLFLSVVEGYTADEIAAMHTTVRGTILSMLSRSKKKLRTSMQAESVDVATDSLTAGGAGSNVVKIENGRRLRKQVES